MNYIQKIKRLTAFAVLIYLIMISVATAYDPTWTRSQCGTYSYHGLNERYVYGSNNGWIDNNVWDSTAVEGVDCASYVSRCLGLPDYVPENVAANYPLDTLELYEGAENTVRINSVYDLQQWDLWVYRGSSNHTGLFKQYSGSSIITREARSATSGVVEGSFSIQYLIDKGARFYRRSNWVSQPVPPTVVTNPATNVLYSSAKLNATITSSGTASVDQRGFNWGVTTACSDGWLDGTPSDDDFSATLTNLDDDRTYYFQALAHNSAGWSYGSVRSFRTDDAPSTPEYIIDNGQTGTSYTGSWDFSGGADPYGGSSLYSRDGATYTWTYNSLPSGLYTVSMWWTEFSSRSSNAPVTINYTGGTASTTVNQQINGGQWSILGQYYFDGQGSVTLLAPGAYPTSYSADAVKFTFVETNQQPVAIIDSISPQFSQVGQQVTMIGHGTDDGSITAYEWASSRDGLLGTAATIATSSLSEGTHVISFRVRDDLNVWSETVEETTTVVSQPSSDEFVIDNGDAGTDSTGSWKVSGGENPWEENSLYGRDGATYSWNVASLTPGFYEVFMWWTEFSTRSSSASIQIAHADGLAEVSVNQQTNGGQWNSLGQFNFNNSGTVTLFAPLAYPTSYCADAVKFVKLSSTVTVTADFSATPTSGNAPLTVSFTDLSSASSAIDSWQWDFDNDGTIDSTQQNPTFVYMTPGIYSVSLAVSAGGFSDELVITDYIEVLDPISSEEIIVDNGDSGTSSTGIWGFSGGTNPYDGDSLWARETATYRWYFTAQKGGMYEVSLWWTEFSSRGTAVPVSIYASDGTTLKTVNQQANGGQWNSVGTYRMNAGQPYYVQVSTTGDGSTTSADAVRIQWISY